MNLYNGFVLRLRLLLLVLVLVTTTTTANAQEQEQEQEQTSTSTTASASALSEEQLNIIASAKAASVNCSDYQANFTFPSIPNSPLTLYYSVQTDDNLQGFLKVRLVLEDIQAWLSVGFSTNGRMVGSTAVIGRPDALEKNSESSIDNAAAVGLYSLASQFVTGVAPLPAEQQTLFDTSLTQNDTHTVLEFSKLLTEKGNDNNNNNDIPDILPNGPNSLLVAAGFSNTLGSHPYFVAIDITLEPCTQAIPGGQSLITEQALNSQQHLLRAHGWVAAVSWGILAPLAIGASMNRHLLPTGPMWLYIHMTLHGLVVLGTTVSFSLAYKAMENADLEHFEPQEGVNGNHYPIGLVIFIVVLVQALGGFVRPHLPHHKDEPVSTIRKLWEMGHRIGGMALVAMAWYNCHSGLELYATKYFADKTYTNVFWAVTLVLWGLMILGSFTKFFILPTKKKEEPEQEKDDSANNYNDNDNADQREANGNGTNTNNGHA